jgi:hypothetical protein
LADGFDISAATLEGVEILVVGGPSDAAVTVSAGQLAMSADSVDGVVAEVQVGVLTVSVVNGGLSGYTIDSDIDVLRLDNQPNSVRLGAVGQTVLGGGGADTVDVGTHNATGLIDLGTGSADSLDVVELGTGRDLSLATLVGVDQLRLVHTNAAVTVSAGQLGIDVVDAGAGADTVSVVGQVGGSVAQVIDAQIDVLQLGSTNDRVTLGAGGQTVVGGGGADTVVVGSLVATGRIDLGLASDAADSLDVVGIAHGADISQATLEGVEILVVGGPSGDAAVTVSAGQLAMSADSVDGVVAEAQVGVLTVSVVNGGLSGYTIDSDIDVLKLDNQANSVTLSATNAAQTVVGGTGADVVRMVSGAVGTIDLSQSTGDTVVVGAGESIHGATLVGVEVLRLEGSGDVVVTVHADHLNTAAESVGEVQKADPSAKAVLDVVGALTDYTIHSGIDRLLLDDTANSVRLSQAAQSVVGGSSGDTVGMIHNATGRIDLGVGADSLDVVVLADGVDISAM